MLFISLYALYALPVPCSKWVYSNNPAEKNKMRKAVLSGLQCNITSLSEVQIAPIVVYSSSQCDKSPYNKGNIH